MRLWHTSLIKVLPREQLIAQWRELSACAGSIQQKGTPNHILVNFIIDYDSSLIEEFSNFNKNLSPFEIDIKLYKI